jgi:predicted PurR-regulated permease PerM
MKNLPLSARIASWLIVAVLGAMILIYAKTFLLPLVIAMLLSLLLYPVHKKLLSWKVPNVLATLISVLIIVVFLVTVIMLVSRQLSEIVGELSKSGGKLNQVFTNLQNYITQNLQIEGATVNSSIENIKAKLVDYIELLVSGTIVGTTNVLSTLVLIIVYVFCFLLFNRSFKNFAFALLIEERKDQALHLINTIQKLVQNYLLGLVIVIASIGILNTIGLLIIGINHAIFFAFFVGILTVIPYVGITIGALVTAFYALVTKDTAWPAFAVICTLIAVQIFESNYFTPKIVGSRVSINPFIVIMVLIIGGELWGIPGMMLSVPLTAILKVILDIYPSTQAIGYFIGSELIDTKNDATEHLHPFNFKKEDQE